MDAFIGEIKAFPFGYPPYGWLLCDGSVYNVQQFPTLFSIIGNTYGGTLNQTFKVPDLQKRVPMSCSQDYPYGVSDGMVSVALTKDELPAHKHTFKCLQVTDYTKMTNQPDVSNYLTAAYSKSAAKGVFAYSNFKKDNTILNGLTVSPAGINVPHENRMPYLVIPFYICCDSDYYPPRP
ncbi:MAG: tail fiber protein [Bacteroidales bacterium]|nr:tail fiber protein [Bacteroidales bacterium]